MAYPASLDTFTTKTNKVDLVDAAHINLAQTTLVAIETELGTDPAGNLTDLKTRLANMMDGNGALNQGTSFPGTTYSGMIFFRTDLGTVYLRNAANSSWGVLTGASNIQIFTASGTFTAPSGITKVYLTMVGGGGGSGGTGSGSTNKGAGGGGGGQSCVNLSFTVVPGNNYTVTIGAGGTAGSGGGGSSGSGGAGGTTSFDSASVLGGSGGTNGTFGGAGDGGAGAGNSAWLDASASVSTYATTGGKGYIKGGNGAKGETGSHGGGGGGTIFAAGADGSAVTSVGVAGTANTGNGAGGAGGGDTPGYAGAVGGSGICIVMY